ncbi:MAG: GNAT family N-acetyltransferase [Armatimonadota bacterium]
MYTKLADETLKTGENMEVGVVLAPDDVYDDQIRPLLGHKGEDWRYHIDESLKGNIEGLETRFYLGLLNGQAICNIMTTEYAGAGILGHVYTLPEQRRKGACSKVMVHQMDDYRRRGGGLMYLGTGFDTPPYWIYHRFGFRSVYEGSGFMRYEHPEGFEDATLFRSGQTRVKDVEWRDWPRINTLTARHDVGYLRSLSLGVFGPSNFEGTFVPFFRRLTDGEAGQAKLLETEHEAIVAMATLRPDSRWRGSVYLLDVFAHPRFLDDVAALLAALEWPDRKVQCYVSADCPDKAELLESEGFRREATFTSQLLAADEPMDVLVLSR